MKEHDVHEFFRRLKEANPQPKSDLEYTTPFTLLVAVVLSAQATDAGVNKATREAVYISLTPRRKCSASALKNSKNI
jgi:endonuclease-3